MNIRSVETVTLYEAYHTDDGGMGMHSGTIGIYTTRSQAEIVTNGNNFSSIGKRKAIKVTYEGRTNSVFATLDDDAQYFILDDDYSSDVLVDVDLEKRREELRESALKKLSKDEREVLGIEA